MPPLPLSSFPTSSAPRPTSLARLRGLTHLLDPAALVSIVRAIVTTRNRLYLQTGTPLPGITQLALALRFYSEKEDTLRLLEARRRKDRNGKEGGEREGRINVSRSGVERTSGSGSDGKVVQEVEMKTVVLEERSGTSIMSRRRTVVDLSLGEGGGRDDRECFEDNKRKAEVSCDGATRGSDAVKSADNIIQNSLAETETADSASNASDTPSFSCEELRDAQFRIGESNHIYLRKVRHLCLVSAAAYASSTEQLKQEYLPSIDLKVILSSKWTAEKFSPAYFIYYDVALNAVIVSIRGTKDIPDMITNLSVETLPFSPNYCLEEPVGYGHAGVIRSARKLRDDLIPVISQALGPVYNRPDCIPESYADKKLILAGHSLGGAVASVLSLMLSTRLFPNTECIAFGAPPCLSLNTSLHPECARITMIMYGLDLVPRLSVDSLERLLTKVLQYDWRRHAGSNAEQWIRSFTSAGSNSNGSVLGPNLNNSSDGSNQLGVMDMVGGAVREYGVDGVVWALESVRNAATASLSNDAAPSGRTATAVAWGAARTATAFVTGLVASQLKQPEVPQRRGRGRITSTGYGRAFGLHDDEVEEALGQSSRQQAKELSTLGQILHFTRDKTDEKVEIRRVGATDLRDIEASLAMVYDHEAERIVEAIAELLGETP